MGGYCFKAGTKVLYDSTSKNIEDIEIGDVVKSWNEITNKVESSKVVKLIQPVHDDMLVIRFSNDVVNENTFDHPYYVKDKGWCSHSPNLTKERYNIDTELLEVGDICYFNSGGGLDEVEVSFIKENCGEVQTYIFELDNNHTFFANGILTHNKLHSLGVEEAVTISGSLNILERKSHNSMSVGDKVLAANIEGLPDTDIYSEFLLWEYTGSIAEVITLVTASIESLSPSSHSEWLVVDCNNGRDDTFKITDNHPLLAKSASVWSFEYAGDIDTNYKLISSSLEEVSINSITEVSSSITGSFMRFDVEPQDTYFADDILVHN
tara:strand:- start:6 stop:971 length:966 start_codon:yes stop_codon:yes gene_type:complete